MRNVKAKAIWAECKTLKSDRNFAYQQAKKDYNALPWKERRLFTIFERA